LGSGGFGVSAALVDFPGGLRSPICRRCEGAPDSLTIPERSAALDAIERQLLYEPLVETRNRKPLRPNPIAPWELRVGKLRVFYEVVPGETSLVRILAVGKKERDILLVAGQEMRL
jgi:mRNA-degrading endonuclease RelE of RelBE toxin-antitoxin system